MRSDSFENFKRYKILVNEKLYEFISNYEYSSEQTKQLVHYQSVLTVSKQIIRVNNSEANALKDLLLEYFDRIEKYDFSNHSLVFIELNDKKRESIKLYNEYISPIGSYLMTESNLEFKIKLPFGCFIFIGIIFDLIIYYFFRFKVYPIATIIFFIIGILYRKFKKNDYKEYGLFK